MSKLNRRNSSTSPVHWPHFCSGPRAAWKGFRGEGCGLRSGHEPARAPAVHLVMWRAVATTASLTWHWVSAFPRALCCGVGVPGSLPTRVTPGKHVSATPRNCCNQCGSQRSPLVSRVAGAEVSSAAPQKVCLHSMSSPNSLCTACHLMVPIPTPFPGVASSKPEPPACRLFSLRGEGEGPFCALATGLRGEVSVDRHPIIQRGSAKGL